MWCRAKREKRSPVVLVGVVTAAVAVAASLVVFSGGAGAQTWRTGAPTFHLTVPVGQWPGATGSQASWQAWAQTQQEAMQTTPWAQELAATGYELVGLSFISVGQVPGLPIPAGVTTTAVLLTYRSTPASGGNTGSRGQTHTGSGQTRTGGGSTGSDPSSCSSITGGTACISGKSETGGQLIEASYTYGGTGTIDGHVEMGTNGCPGTLVGNGPNQDLTNDEYQAVLYWTSRGISEWSSTYWRYNGGTNYTDWGSACGDV